VREGKRPTDPHHASPAARVSNCYFFFRIMYIFFARNNNIVLHTSNRVEQTTRHIEIQRQNDQNNAHGAI